MIGRFTLRQKILAYSALTALVLLILFPIYYMLIISLKLPRDIYRVPSLLPILTPQFDSEGRQIYQVPLTDAVAPGQFTTCSVGYSATAGGACSGTSINSVYNITTDPFVERFLGNSPRPRVSVGIGANWNSPFGPLRLDLAYALTKVEGDDDKLFSFNVGTSF